MRYCFDIDGTITQLRKEGQDYSQVLPINSTLELIKNLKSKGHYIILYTARGMQTHSGNLGKVIATQSKTLFDWLEFYGIPYDEIYFGKPSADFYIDDKAVNINDINK